MIKTIHQRHLRMLDRISRKRESSLSEYLSKAKRDFNTYKDAFKSRPCKLAIPSPSSTLTQKKFIDILLTHKVCTLLRLRSTLFLHIVVTDVNYLGFKETLYRVLSIYLEDIISRFNTTDKYGEALLPFKLLEPEMQKYVIETLRAQNRDVQIGNS